MSDSKPPIIPPYSHVNPGVPRCQWCGEPAPEGFQLHKCGAQDPLGPPREQIQEPVFTLRAADQFAPVLLCVWITMAQAAGVPAAKVKSAENVLKDMLAWQAARGKKRPD